MSTSQCTLTHHGNILYCIETDPSVGLPPQVEVVGPSRRRATRCRVPSHRCFKYTVGLQTSLFHLAHRKDHALFEVGGEDRDTHTPNISYKIIITTVTARAAINSIHTRLGLTGDYCPSTPSTPRVTFTSRFGQYQRLCLAVELGSTFTSVVTPRTDPRIYAVTR